MNVEVYWDLEDRDEYSDYRPMRQASNCPGWLSYVVAETPPES